MNLEIDINTKLFPLNVGESFNFTLASSHSSRKKSCTGNYDVDYSAISDEFTQFDYVSHGRVYKIRDIRTSVGPCSEIYVSFGGLLMLLTGFPKHLENLQLDMEIYLCLKKN